MPVSRLRQFIDAFFEGLGAAVLISSPRRPPHYAGASEDDWRAVGDDMRMAMGYIDRVMPLGDRREALCRLRPHCPACDADQVQLVEYIAVTPARWRCRVCKTRFDLDLPETAQ